ncbi:MAG: EAL domain-containing protein [Deltaproteobacteria bacterium]|nr:EAL domain-containing protein [Deltaproteobacteria bacterium]
MIVLVTARTELAEEVRQQLRPFGIPTTWLRPGDTSGIKSLYAPDVAGAVVDASVPDIPDEGWHDLLTNLGRRLPVVVLGENVSALVRTQLSTVTWLDRFKAEDVLSVLDACGAIGVSFRRLKRDNIPTFSPQVPLHMLQQNGVVSLLTIDVSSFRKISIEYGTEAYQRVQDCFHQLLFELWGSAGCFRGADQLCRRSVHGNQYYVFLEQSRAPGAIPPPGSLEQLADRLVVRLQNAFWREIFVDGTERLLPDCITMVPEISVGFGTVLNNPAVDAFELIEQVIETSYECARAQLKRTRDRQRELMQTLIQTKGLLEPHYQAVFTLPQLTKDMVDEAHSSNSIKPLRRQLFGFESLVRVRPQAIDALFQGAGLAYLEPRYLRPDVLFSLSHNVKVGLELDQACLQQAVHHASKLPGTLLLNILPRNLYNLDKLMHLLGERSSLMFEVSETEAINNFDIMLRVRENLDRMHMRIATDDFGRGHSGLEQIVKLKPDLVKLDRSLIQDLHRDESKQDFVAGLIRAARISCATILAEGVERWEEAEVLQRLGVDLVQGFLFHKPQSANVIEMDLDYEHPMGFKGVA